MEASSNKTISLKIAASLEKREPGKSCGVFSVIRVRVSNLKAAKSWKFFVGFLVLGTYNIGPMKF
jgi:hypothetical protein